LHRRLNTNLTHTVMASRIAIPAIHTLVKKTKLDAALRKIAELENQLRRQTQGCTMAYPQVIAHLTNGQYAVVEGNDACQQNITTLADNAITLYQLGNTFPGRPNEFGNHMESFIESHGPMVVERPRTTAGKGQKSGYPDCFVNVSNGTSFYLEIKIYKEGSNHSAFRSFFVSTGNKITTTCPHYLLGFEHREKKLTGNYHIVDLSTKCLCLKAEWATGNRELYS